MIMMQPPRRQKATCHTWEGQSVGRRAYRILDPGPYWPETGHAHTTVRPLTSVELAARDVVSRRAIVAAAVKGAPVATASGMRARLSRADTPAECARIRSLVALYAEVAPRDNQIGLEGVASTVPGWAPKELYV
jgi:hypothetical protein